LYTKPVTKLGTGCAKCHVKVEFHLFKQFINICDLFVGNITGSCMLLPSVFQAGIRRKFITHGQFCHWFEIA